MTEKASLLIYINNELRESTREPAITKAGSDLELAIISSYQAQQGNLRGLHKTRIFEMYLEAEDIDRDMIGRYLEGLKGLQTAVYHTSESSWLRKLAHKTEKWHEKGYHRNHLLPYLTDAMAVAVGLFGVVGVEVALEGHPEVLRVAAPILTVVGTYIGLFCRKTELKPKTHEFKTDQARDYILELRRFHLLCQEMEREVADIERFDDQQKYEFVKKQGIKKMKQERVSTKRLTTDERERRTLEYGAREINEKIQAARLEVKTVRESVEAILTASGAELIELDSDYVPKGVRDYHGQHDPIEEMVDQELAATDPHVKAETLRKRAAAAKITQ